MEDHHPGKKIRFLLHTHSMPIQALALHLGVTKEAMREMVDEEAMPTPQLLLKIAQFFKLRDDYFAGAAASSPVESLRTPPTPLRTPPPPPLLRPAPPVSPPLRPAPPAPPPLRPAPPGGVSDPVGRPPRAGQSRPRRGIDMVELAARHQALLDCLLAREAIFLTDYERRLAALRSKVSERTKSV